MTHFPSNKSTLPASLRMMFGLIAALVFSMSFSIANAGKKPGPATPYTYSYVGNPDFSPALTQDRANPSYVLMGGGLDVDEAFRWMIMQAGVTSTAKGGRLVVIRATGDGAYNPYIYYSDKKSSVLSAVKEGWVGGASLGLTSVETLVIPSTAAANNTFVNEIAGRANAVWIAGGDQSDYIKFWKGTSLETTLKGLMAKNVPIGGTSAGLAVLGGFDFTAMNGSVTSVQALSDPYNSYMTFDPTPLSTAGGFILPPIFTNTIMDSHLDTRDRMGRLIAFVSRLIGTYQGPGNQQYGCTGGVIGNNTAKGIGIGEQAALLVWGNSSGGYKGKRVTNSSTTTESAVYFVNVTQGPTVCSAGKPLEVPTSSVTIRKLAESNSTINLPDWSLFPIYTSVGVSSGVLNPPNPY